MMRHAVNCEIAEKLSDNCTCGAAPHHPDPMAEAVKAAIDGFQGHLKKIAERDNHGWVEWTQMSEEGQRDFRATIQAATKAAISAYVKAQMEGVMDDGIRPLIVRLRSSWSTVTEQKQAADEIERAASIIATYRTRCKELEEGLRPFAKFARHVAKEHGGWDHDGFSIHPTFQTECEFPNMGAFRRAAQLIAMKGNSDA